MRIAGIGFSTQPINTINFGSTLVAARAACEPALCVATAQAGTGSVDVMVNTHDVTSATGVADVFTYTPNPVPSLIRLTPLSELRGARVQPLP